MIDYLIYFLASYAIYILPPLILIYYILTSPRPSPKEREKCNCAKLNLGLAPPLEGLGRSGWGVGLLETILIALSGVLTWIINHYFLKNYFKLPRPITAGEIIQPDTLYSFPSGHTTFMIALATALYSYDKKLGLITFIFGLLIGLSRVWLGVHFYRDILGGIVVGIICGFVIIRILKKIPKHESTPTKPI